MNVREMLKVRVSGFGNNTRGAGKSSGSSSLGHRISNGTSEGGWWCKLPAQITAGLRCGVSHLLYLKGSDFLLINQWIRETWVTTQADRMVTTGPHALDTS